MAIDYVTNSRIGEGSVIGAAAGAGRRPVALGIAAGILPVIGPAVAGGILMSVLAIRRRCGGGRHPRRRPHRTGHPGGRGQRVDEGEVLRRQHPGHGPGRHPRDGGLADPPVLQRELPRERHRHPARDPPLDPRGGPERRSPE